jgi:glyoxylase-like metal-dependent hydrolase (beta-lactamase superfamily II)
VIGRRAAGGCPPRSLGGASRRWAPLALLWAAPALAQDPPAWTRPIAPFAVTGTVTYVGTEGLSAYLIRTAQGAILIDAPMEENADRVARSIEAAGVRLRDVRYILLTHAHFDHAGALARLRALTGAQVVVGAGDRAAVESGVPPGETSYAPVRFPPARVDRVVRDGGRVTLGGVTLTAIATPGHTPGCTGWEAMLPDAGRVRRVVFPCSLTVAGNRLVGNRRYPGIVADFRRSFARMARVRAEIVLPAHPEVADVVARGRRRAAGEREAFIAPGLLPRITRESAAAFDAELARQRAAALPPTRRTR